MRLRPGGDRWSIREGSKRASGIEDKAEQRRSVDQGIGGVWTHSQVKSRNAAIFPQHEPDVPAAGPPPVAVVEARVPDRGKGERDPSFFEDI